MARHVALSVLGKDRPGIVEGISKALFETGCNIEDSSMTILEGEFAMILIVELGKKAGLSTLKSRLVKTAKKMKLTTSVRELTLKESMKEKPSKNKYIVSVYGSDRPGIVYKISSVLAKNKANITDVQTSRSPSGRNAAYMMILETDFASREKAESIKSQLRQIAKALDVRIGMNPVEIPQL